MPFLNKKSVESSDDEKTGEYDLAEIEASEEDESVEKSPLMRFVKTQLPFLAKFLPKKSNKKNIDLEEEVHTSDATQETSLQDVETSKAKWEEVLEKQVPALYKVIVKVKAPKKNQVASSASGEKKKKIKPIHIVIILGLVYLSFEELINPEEESSDPTQVQTTPPVPKNNVEPAPDLSETPADVVDVPEEVEDIPTPVEIPSEVPPPSEITQPEPVVEEPEPVIEEEPEPAVVETPTNDEAIDDENIDLGLTEEEPPIEPEPEEVPSEIVDEPTPQVETIPSDIYNTDQDITSSILESLENKVKKQKVVREEEVLEPSEAPDYDYKGRGLVYNCVGGHWACIDDESFKSCSKNYNWNSAQGKTIECYSEQVYATEEDCSRAQLLKIDSVAKTNFCN